MDFTIFAPKNLPGVGMGDTYSLEGIGGLIGLAVSRRLDASRPSVVTESGPIELGPLGEPSR